MVIGLRTVKGTKQLKLDPLIYYALQKEKVLPGDVIYIEANSGAALVRLTIPFSCPTRAEPTQCSAAHILGEALPDCVSCITSTGALLQSRYV